jgi:predicted heme/steroid binding protein
MNKLIIKIIFYALIIGVAIAGTVLYIKSQPVTMNNEQQTMNNSMGTSATCIITIDGQKYDVESLRSTHTGGDIFQCGTDMSAAFHRKHDDNLQMIQKYLVK